MNGTHLYYDKSNSVPMGTSVVLLVGLPGSGKSSLARRLCESRQSSIHIEYDRIASSLIEDEQSEPWRRTVGRC
jgi:adenylate kinase family enzyme